MIFNNPSFKTYVLKNSTEGTRSKIDDSQIIKMDISGDSIHAVVSDSAIYMTKVEVERGQIKKTECSCLDKYSGICKHVLLTIVEADKKQDFSQINLLDEVEIMVETKKSKYKAFIPNFNNPDKHIFSLHNFEINELSPEFIEYFSSLPLNQIRKNTNSDVNKIEYNYGDFSSILSYWDHTMVSILLNEENKTIQLQCSCNKIKYKMCEHQSAMMFVLFNRRDIRIYFDKKLREESLKEIAKSFGLENESNLDEYFTVGRKNDTNFVIPKRKDLLSFDNKFHEIYQKELLPSTKHKKINTSEVSPLNKLKGIVFSQSKYSSNFYIFYFEANTTKDGNIKNPLKEINPIHDLDKYNKVDEIRFISTLNLFKDRYDNSITKEEKFKALRIIAKNPINFPFYYHDTKISENITVQSVKKIDLKIVNHSYISFQVNENPPFYEISAFLYINDNKHNLKAVKIRYEFLFMVENNLYLIDNPYYIKLFQFLKTHDFKLSIHQSKFEEFKIDYLDKLDKDVEINYSFIKPATKKQLANSVFNHELKKTIYIEESESFILITPSVRYGNLEVPILSLKQIHEKDANGDWFHVERDKHLENNFAGLLLRQHPDFETQIGQFEHFHLHKQEFLDSGWFIDAFETWKNHEIEVLGFNTIKNNKLSTNKMKVSVLVNRGLDWFDTAISIKFGNEEVSLKQVQKALKNANRFIPLGDGTLGLMPEEWIEKFSKYFRSSEIVDGYLRTAKINFSEIEALYEQEVLSKDVAEEISFLNSKIANFKSIHDVKIPNGLNAELRDYQKQGLNWLNFLDEFNFGGCLADDMGLGKTIQIITFILLQKEKNKNLTNLIVVPTSLLFNWEREVEKFAPSLKLSTIYGTNRIKNTKDFSKVDIILTTYGTMMSDVKILKEFHFHYIFLDESQAIKNPDSQRYQAVRLLQAKNRVVLTGTPIENNTFDLFAQMSFVNPGLFINQNRFREEYSIPIDKFKDSARAKELQQKINPFVLRRTKKQVAKELPDKTEMILYCEMDDEQRNVYETYKKEIRDGLLGLTDIPKENKSMLVLQGLTKLRQICNSPALLSDTESYGNSSAKIRILLEEIENKAHNHKILIFSQFVGMLDLIRKELDERRISHEYLTGQTKNREEKVHNFQNDQEIRVFLISLKAGGTGLNLTEADYVYLVDPWWNPAVENQAIDRCYRIGQKKNVVAVRLITPNTIEDKILLLQADKKELAEDLIKTDTSVMKSLSSKELMNLFS